MSDAESHDTQISTRDLPEGFLIAGRYEVQEPLGTGGMGTVYLANDRVLGGEPIAIKILRSDLVNDVTHTRRFLREVQLMRRVNHKNVVRTFDVGVDSSLVYFTMEYVPGTSLARLLEKHSFSTEELGNLIIQIVEGLEAVHQQSIIHRDLKPGNIIVLPDSSIKITDFGVARPEYSDLTAHNEVIGSSAYMAPETWNGKPPTNAVDYYSLGVILYEITTGTHPFKADSPAALMRLHLEKDPVAPREINKSVQTWINRLILRLLEKNPAQRMSDPAEVIDYVQLQLTPQSERVKESTSSASGGEPLVSDALLNRLEELSQKAIDQNQGRPGGMSGSFPALASPAASLMVQTFWQGVPGSKYIPHAARVLCAQLVKGCIAALALVVVSVLLHFLISGPAAREDSVLSLLLMQNVADPALEASSHFGVLSTCIPHLVVLLIVSLMPAAFLLAMAATWEHLFKSLSRLAMLYLGIFLVLSVWNAYPELRHAALSPATLVAAFSAAAIQLVHVLLLSPTNVLFESAVTSQGLVLSSSAPVGLLSQPVFALCMLVHVAALSYFTLGSLASGLRRPAAWQAVGAVLLILLIPIQGSIFPLPTEAATLILPTFQAATTGASLKFGLLNWTILLLILAGGIAYTCTKGNIVFGSARSSAE